jgi:hypothetical protein
MLSISWDGNRQEQGKNCLFKGLSREKMFGFKASVKEVEVSDSPESKEREVI